MIFCGGETQFMKHVLEMQYISVLLKYTKLISWGVFFFFLHVAYLNAGHLKVSRMSLVDLVSGLEVATYQIPTIFFVWCTNILLFCQVYGLMGIQNIDLAMVMSQVQCLVLTWRQQVFWNLKMMLQAELPPLLAEPQISLLTDKL